MSLLEGRGVNGSPQIRRSERGGLLMVRRTEDVGEPNDVISLGQSLIAIHRNSVTNFLRDLIHLANLFFCFKTSRVGSLLISL